MLKYLKTNILILTHNSADWFHFKLTTVNCKLDLDGTGRLHLPGLLIVLVS